MRSPANETKIVEMDTIKGIQEIAQKWTDGGYWLHDDDDEYVEVTIVDDFDEPVGDHWFVRVRVTAS